MNDPIVYDYKGSQISFINGDSVMINATQMAKPFGKRPIDYLRLPSTNELLNAIVRKFYIDENQLVISKKGSAENGGGTWMHEDDGNKLLFSIAYLKKLRNFAMHYISKGGEVRKILWAIFMSASKNIRFHAPVSSVNATAAFRGVVQRVSVEPFFNFHKTNY